MMGIDFGIGRAHQVETLYVKTNCKTIDEVPAWVDIKFKAWRGLVSIVIVEGIKVLVCKAHGVRMKFDERDQCIEIEQRKRI